ncbi:MAG: S8 family serine peptidase [Marinicellaceae bacterium]
MMRLIILLFLLKPVLAFSQEQNKRHYIVGFDLKPISLIKPSNNEAELIFQQTQKIKQQHSTLLSQLSSNFNRQIQSNFSYIHALNAISLYLTEAEVDYINQLDGIKTITEEYYLHPATDASASMVKADDIWLGNGIDPLPSTQGEGIVVGIIDTGINLTHESFSDTPEDNYDFASNNPYGADEFVGWCHPNHPNYDISFVCNNKYIGAWDFVDSFGNEADGPLDNNFHGSHMSGVIGGNKITAPPDGFAFSFGAGFLNAPFLSGIAPHAHLIMYDACDNTIGCPVTAVLAAIEQAILDEVDIINMSLIGDNNPWQDNSISIALLNASNLGIITSTAAGNATAQQPSTLARVSNLAPWVMTAANSYHGRTQSNDLTVISDGPVADFLIGIYTVIANGITFIDNIESNIVYSKDINTNNESGCSPWPEQAFDGVVALIKTSIESPLCANEIKVQNAEDAGAIAVVLFSTESDLPESLNAINAPMIPTTMIGFSDAQNLINQIQENAPMVTDIEIQAESTHKVVDALGMVLYHSSLRGPNNGFNITKPDITAPGTDIFAAIAELGQPSPQYYTATGTSQSTAVISGSLALLKSLKPDLNPSALKSVMMLTANNSLMFDDGSATNSDDIGSGMLNIVDAVNSVLVLNENTQNYQDANPLTGGKPKNLNLASLRDNHCGNGCSWVRTFTNTDSVTHQWNISSVSDKDSEILISESILNIRPGASKTVEITFVPISGALEEHRFGQIILKDSDSILPDSQLTLVVYLNDLIFNNGFE